MKIAIHDFGCYSFPLQLARRMALDGHDVHYFCSDFYETKGACQRLSNDPINLVLEVVSIGQKHKKYSFVKRAFQEYLYGRKIQEKFSDESFDYILSCNTPIIVAGIISRWCFKNRVRYIHWMQDIHSIALKSIFKTRNILSRVVVCELFRFAEKKILETADTCVTISDDFIDEIKKMGAKPKQVVTIPNWMPLNEIFPADRINHWATRNNLENQINIMYVGTLSLKHSKDPFIWLAEEFRSNSNVRLVVVSAGIVFEEIRDEVKLRKLENVVLLGWQKYEELSLVLGAADILFAALSPEGSQFSIPCKILTYACAGRPVLAYMPKSNLVARIVEQNKFGIAIDVGNKNGLIKAARQMVIEKSLRLQYGLSAREYAVNNFNITEKVSEFYKIMPTDFSKLKN